MKNKLKLAIISIILPAILQILVISLGHSFNDGFGFRFRNFINFLMILCSLGTLPFFISLYKSKEFNALLEKESKINNNNGNKDENWINHFLLRIGVILIICLALISVLLVSTGVNEAYLISYGIVATIGVSFIVLIIEAIFLFRKKSWNKFYCNIAIIVFLFLFGINLL